MRRDSTLRFSRRDLLRGLGAGAAFLAPFMRYRSSIAAPADGGNLLIFFTPNGHKRSLQVGSANQVCFDATSNGTEMILGKSLMPLEPYKNDVAVIKGLNLKTPTFIASHQDICRILTCRNYMDSQSKESSAGQIQFTGYGPSIDQYVGMKINQRPLVCAVDPYRDSPHWRTFLSWRASGTNEPFTKNFNTSFTDLFGSLTGQPSGTDQQAALERTRARNKSLIDFVKGDVNTFRSRINSNDKAHLDAYLDAIQGVEQRVTQMPAVPGVCTSDPLMTRIAGLGTAPKQNDDKSPAGLAMEMQKRGELWMDMIATAFACGTRRVATIQWQGASEGYDVTNDSGSPDHHSVSHYGFGQASGDRWVAIDTWYSQRFAYMLNALKTLNVLDKTVIAWVSEITEGHNQLNMVSVVAGGRSLGMKLGQYIKYPFKGNEVEGSNAINVGRDPANKSISDLWVTCQNAMGVNEATFGDPTVCGGPLTELRTA
jgi:hypothetical protein